MEQSIKDGSGAATPLARLAIPETFHFMWFGGEIPQELAMYPISWINRHPGWQVQIWNENNLPALRNQDLFDNAEEIAGDCAGQLRADVARLEVLEEFGGVYVDCDFECLKPITPLLDGVECFAAWEEQDKWINNAIFGSVPHHLFLRDLIKNLPDNVERKKRHRPNVMSGPQFVTPVWMSGFYKDVRIFPQSYFYPYSYSELDRSGDEFPDAYAVHHWNNKRSKAKK